MKNLKVILGAGTLFVLSAVHSIAIEGLALSVRCPDVWLSWPSMEGETYIVQYRPDLDPTATWVTLTNSLPAAVGTNVTVFVHSNQVDCPEGQTLGLTTGRGENATANKTDSEIYSAKVESDAGLWPQIVSEDKSYPPVPLQLYPPGMDLSGRIVLWPDGSTELWTKELAEKCVAAAKPDEQQNHPLDNGGNEPACGFYRVVRVGLHPIGIANGAVLSGQVVVRFELGAEGGAPFGGITVTANEQPVNGYEFLGLVDGALTAVWDTTAVANGPYELVFAAELGNDTIEASPVSVVVSNRIWFPNLWPVAGSLMRMEVQTVHTNGYWIMEFYDDQDEFLGWLDGPVDEHGWCNVEGVPGPGFSLLLEDAQGNPLPSSYYAVDVYTWPPAGEAGASGGMASASVTNFIERPWLFRTRFAVAYEQIYPPNSWNALLLQTMMQAVAAAAQARWSIDPVRGNPFVPFALAGEAEWNLLRQDLTNTAVRNLYFFGHGNASAIGRGDGSPQITCQELCQLLGNARNPLQGTNRHAYRFVFLDGCRTASGGLPQAFGIPKGNVGEDEFWQKRGLRPRAFVGWPNRLLGGFIVFSGAHSEFIGRFFDLWQAIDPETGQPRRVDRALYLAARNNQGHIVYAQGTRIQIHGFHGLTFWEW